MRRPLADGDSSSLFSRLPDELVLQILNKIIDLKTLCTCKLVSKSFSSIVVQIDSVSLTVSSEFNLDNYNVLLPFSSNSFVAATNSILSFTRLRSLHIHLSLLTTGSCNFKWKVKVSNRVDSFLFVSPVSIYSSDTHTSLIGVNESSPLNEEEGPAKKFAIALRYYNNAITRLMLLLSFDFPLLKYVSVTDSGNWQNVCFNSSDKISQFRDLIHSENAASKLTLSENYSRFSWCYVPFLRLPVSGYVMKGVTLRLLDRDDVNDESYNNVVDDKDDGFEQDKEAAAYREAIIEIFKKHRGSINRVPLAEFL